MSKKSYDEEVAPAADPNTPTHINGSEVTGVGEPNADGKCEVACKDGKQYVWNSKTQAIYPAGHPQA